MAMLKLMFHKAHVKGYWLTKDGQRVYIRPYERTNLPSRYSAAFIERICRLYDLGHSSADIATMTEVGKNTVRHLLYRPASPTARSRTDWGIRLLLIVTPAAIKRC